MGISHHRFVIVFPPAPVYLCPTHHLLVGYMTDGRRVLLRTTCLSATRSGLFAHQKVASMRDLRRPCRRRLARDAGGDDGVDVGVDVGDTGGNVDVELVEMTPSRHQGSVLPLAVTPERALVWSEGAWLPGILKCS